MSETFNLDRETNITNNIDAEGKKWEIHFNRGTALCHVRPNPDRSDAVIPTNMAGQWTKPSLLQEEIQRYITSSWDKAEAAKQKADRKAHAKKVEAKKE